MKQKSLLKVFFLLCALIVGSTSVWADPETITSFNAVTYHSGTTGEWSVTNPNWQTGGGGYYLLGYSNADITSPSINWSNYTEIKIKLKSRAYGGPTSDQKLISIMQGNTTLNTYSPTGTSLVYSDEISISPTGIGSLKIVCNGASSNKGSGISEIIISGTPATPAYTITPAVNVSSMGSASVLGSVITAAPNSGYRVKSGDNGWTVISGSATVAHEGYSNTFTVTPSSNCTVQINFEEKENPTFAFEPTSKSVNYGDDVTEPALSTNSTGTVSYVSSNTNVATVDEDGQVTILAVGTTIITASITEDAAYKSANASYTLTVNEYAPTPTIPEEEIVFQETFAGCDGTGGNDGEWSGNIASKTYENSMADNTGWTMNNPYAADGCVKMGTGSKLGKAKTPALALETSVTYTLKFRAGAWSGKSTNLKLSMEEGTLSSSSVTMKDGDFDSFELTITNASADAKITFEGNAASNSQFFLDDVKVTTISTPGVYVTVPSSGWGTFCSPYALDLGNSNNTCLAYTVSDYDATAGTITVQKQTGKVAAKTPLLVYAENETGSSITKKLVVTNEAGSAVDGNKLRGFLSPTYYAGATAEETLLGMSGGTFKKLSAGTTLKANRAALVMTTEDFDKLPTSGDTKLTFIIEDETETDGINSHRTNFVKYDGNAYNLNGQRVGNDFKGIVIVNGKKVVRK